MFSSVSLSFHLVFFSREATGTIGQDAELFFYSLNYYFFLPTIYFVLLCPYTYTLFFMLVTHFSHKANKCSVVVIPTVIFSCKQLSPNCQSPFPLPLSQFHHSQGLKAVSIFLVLLEETKYISIINLQGESTGSYFNIIERWQINWTRVTLSKIQGKLKVRIQYGHHQIIILT